MIKKKKPGVNKVHIAGRGSVVRQLRILASQFRVLRTGTLSEIRPDNMYQPLYCILTFRELENSHDYGIFRGKMFFEGIEIKKPGRKPGIQSLER